MNLNLIFPPAWIPTQPYLSVPTLYSYLYERNIDVNQHDLNLDFYDYLLSENFIESIRHSGFLDDFNIENESNQLYYFFLKSNIDRIKQKFRSTEALNIIQYANCVKFFASYFSFLSKRFDIEISFTTLDIGVDCFNTESLYKCFQGNIESKGFKFLSQVLSKFIEKICLNYDSVAISITGVSQIIPSFVLIGLIKKKYPNINIIVGGSVTSRWKEQLLDELGFFDYINYVILNEGEESLYCLSKFLEGSLNIGDVPNLMYRKDNKIIINNIKRGLYFEDLPTPKFNKEDLIKYFSPGVILPLLATRGCYWGKCSFCDHSFVYGKNYRICEKTRLEKYILEYVQEYNVKLINFHDESISPKGIEMISDIVSINNLSVYWTCDSRFEELLDKNILLEAKRYGLRVLFFGLESCNQRVLNKMNKGTEINKITRILKDSSDVGIWNHTFFICGFPTETGDELIDTIKFICRNEDIIHSQGAAIFSLNKLSLVSDNPSEYGLRIKQSRDKYNLSYEYDNIEKNVGKDNEYVETVYNFATNSNIGRNQLISKIIHRDHWGLYACSQEIQRYRSKSDLRDLSNFLTQKIGDKFYLWEVATNQIKEITQDTFMLFNVYSSVDFNVKKTSLKLIEEYDLNYDEAIEFINKLDEILKESFYEGDLIEDELIQKPRYNI